MKLIPWTVFLDMLGYSSLNEGVKNKDEALKIVSDLNSFKSNFIELNSQSTTRKSDIEGFYDINFSFISDSIIISFEPKEVSGLTNEDIYNISANALFYISMKVSFLAAIIAREWGVILRGGVSSKYSYIDKEFVVGEGVVDAYNTESKLAIYPRVAISESTIQNEKLMENIDFLSRSMLGGKRLIVEENQVFYLDTLMHLVSFFEKDTAYHTYNAGREQFFILDGVFSNYKEIIKRNFQEFSAASESSQRVIEKYEWLKNYQNRVIRESTIFEELKQHIID